MPREGPSYFIDDVWRARVRDRLTELGKRPAWLAATSKCPKSMLSELMSGKRGNSTYIPEIHQALGMPPPMGPLMSTDDEEWRTILAGMTDEQKGRLRERALTMLEDNKKRR